MKKEPHKGLSNLVGGKIELHENGLAAAYRELSEETGVWVDSPCKLPQMIEHISKAYTDKTLVDTVKEPFLSLLNNCLSVLKPGGYLVMSHYMFQYDLDLGYNPDLNELFLDGFDPQWWLFYQK